MNSSPRDRIDSDFGSIYVEVSLRFARKVHVLVVRCHPDLSITLVFDCLAKNSWPNNEVAEIF